MRLRMERGTTSILQYQLLIETILTRCLSWFLLAPARWSEKSHSVPAYHLSSPSFTLPFQVTHRTIFQREAQLQPNLHTHSVSTAKLTRVSSIKNT
jgi:hypothetical protein